MTRPTIALGALLGGLTSLPAIALSFLAWRLAGLPFVPFDLFDWLARALPGDLVTLGIDAMVKAINALKGVLNLGSTSTAAKTAEQLLALALGMLGGVLLGGVVAGLLRRDERRGWRVGAAVGLAAFILVAVIELDLGLPGSPSAGSGQAPALALPWLALLLTGWGAVLGYLLRAQTAPVMDEAAAPAEASLHAARRAALIKIAGGSALAALGAWGLGRLLGPEPKETGAGQPLSDLPPATPEPGAGASPALPQVTASATTRDRIAPAPGTRPELTPNEDFYRIDINTRPVAIDGASWVLEVAGLFDNPRPLTLADLRAYPPVTQPITLSCISNPIGGDLIGTSNWTGVRLRDLLKDLGLRPEARELLIEAADGFYESVAMEDMIDPRTLLVYGMNGETLPVEHGFPLRIYIPDRYGMKQPKWITRIEAIDEKGPGYWVKRGWSAEARPQIVSVIDTIAREEIVDGRVPIGGIAWAGERGIQKVEVQVDDGEWVAATLRTPPLGPLTWAQWRYDWPSSPGRHTFRVRATDGSGALQIEQKQDVRPDGATGYHVKSVTI
jgi:DMSO/TMAO reductase YedYZ molybdopterin-dependent catalytic subunit